MIDFLAGVPGKLKTLLDRLSATWAAKLDTLHTLLSSTWAAKLDSLRAAYTDTKAGYIDVAISSRATDSNPILAAPMASGLMGGDPQALQGAPFFGGVTATIGITSTSYVDIVNYTGAGVVKLAAYMTSSGSGTMKITIDGVVVGEYSTGAATSYLIVSPIGLVGSQYLASLDAVPFKTSLLIQAKQVAAGNGSAYVKWHKTA